MTEFCNRDSFSHCLAIISACLLFVCYSVIYRGAEAFFFIYCSCFSFSCSKVIRGRCFSCQISNFLCRLQQFSTGPSCLRSLLSLLRSLFSNGISLAQSSSDLFLEYITETFSPLTLKSGLVVFLKATAASYYEQNSMKAKSFFWSVILFLIIRISLTEAYCSNKSKISSSSVSMIIGPLTIKLNKLILSSLFLEALAAVLQFSLQYQFFSFSQRQHFSLLAKFLQSQRSQYQSYAIFRSYFRQGQKFTLYSFFSMVIFQDRNPMMVEETYIDGYLAKTLLSFNSISSGTLVAAFMLTSIKALSTAATSVQFSILIVLVSQTFHLGSFYYSSESILAYPSDYYLFLFLFFREGLFSRLLLLLLLLSLGITIIRKLQQKMNRNHSSDQNLNQSSIFHPDNSAPYL